MRDRARALSWSLIAVLAAVVGFALAGAAARAESAPPPLSIAVAGDHFVNSAGNTVQLVGADVPSTEYACEEGWGYSSDDGAALASQVASWGINVVRIPLNEDCWLGINGQPTGSGYSAAGYQSAIESFVAELNADGIYAILDLHWSAPGSYISNGQEPMPDDHSEAFWTSVAGAFKSNPAVIFDLFNEPYSPVANAGMGSDAVSWSCWRNGGCTVPVIQNTSTVESASYTAVGMQSLVDTIRATGATQPIMIAGLQWAEDLSGWLANEPSDTLATPQLAASFHNYDGDGECDDTSCWNSTIAPVAAQVPVLTGEFGQTSCTDDFDTTYMNWADQHGVSYVGWGWFIGVTPGCPSDGDSYYLVDSAGDPAPPNGVALHAQLQTLGAPGGLTTTSTASTGTTSTGTTTTTTTTGTTTTGTTTITPTASTPTLTATAPLTSSSAPVPAKPPTAARRCLVPSLTGDTLAQASRRIRAAHCSLGAITRPRSHRALVVSSSTPKAGSRERNGARVAIRMRNRVRRA